MAKELHELPSATPSAAETLGIDVAGRIVRVPVPDGMVDLATEMKKVGATADSAADPHQRAVLVPIAAWREFVRTGQRRYELVMTVAVPGGDLSNDRENESRFARTREQVLRQAPWPVTPESRRLAQAVQSWAAGARQELESPPQLATGEHLGVEVRSPDSRHIQALIVSRLEGTPASGCDIVARSTVLVHGRVVDLTWIRHGMPLRVGALVEARDGGARWAESVLSANP